MRLRGRHRLVAPGGGRAGPRVPRCAHLGPAHGRRPFLLRGARARVGLGPGGGVGPDARLPMKRDGDGGEVFDFGSVDKTETKKSALNILEGGEVAFQRRREIYGY